MNVNIPRPYSCAEHANVVADLLLDLPRLARALIAVQRDSSSRAALNEARLSLRALRSSIDLIADYERYLDERRSRSRR